MGTHLNKSQDLPINRSDLQAVNRLGFQQHHLRFHMELECGITLHTQKLTNIQPEFINMHIE